MSDVRKLVLKKIIDRGYCDITIKRINTRDINEIFSELQATASENVHI